MFSGTNYECRLTMNNLVITAGGDKPLLEDQKTEFYELEYTPFYEQNRRPGRVSARHQRLTSKRTMHTGRT